MAVLIILIVNLFHGISPVITPCPRCGGFMVTKNYKSGEHEICTNKECGYKSKK